MSRIFVEHSTFTRLSGSHAYTYGVPEERVQFRNNNFMKKLLLLGSAVLSILPLMTVVLLPASASADIIDYEIHLDEPSDYTGASIPQAQAYLQTTGTTTCSWSYPKSGILEIGDFSNDWSTLYSWKIVGTVTGGGTGVLTCGDAAVPVVTSSAGNTTVNSQGIFSTTVTVQSNLAIPNAIIDAEAYPGGVWWASPSPPIPNTGPDKIAQAFTTVNIPTNTPVTCTIYGQTFPVSSGDKQFITNHGVPNNMQTVEVGIFTANWGMLENWNRGAYGVINYPIDVSATSTASIPPAVCTVAGGSTSTTTVSSGSSTSTPPPSTSTGTIDQNGQTVRAGTSIDFVGHNFGHEESVAVNLNGATVATAHADGGGNFSTGSLSAPTTPGSYTYTFIGQRSGIAGSATITITP